MEEQALLDNGGSGLDNGGTGLDNGGTGLDNGGTGLDNGGTGLDNGGTGLTRQWQNRPYLTRDKQAFLENEGSSRNMLYLTMAEQTLR
jgi:hypothetical protein